MIAELVAAFWFGVVAGYVMDNVIKLLVDWSNERHRAERG